MCIKSNTVRQTKSVQPVFEKLESRLDYADIAAAVYAFHPNYPTSERAEAQRPIEINPRVTTFLRIIQRIGRQADCNRHVNLSLRACIFDEVRKDVRCFKVISRNYLSNARMPLIIAFD